MRDQSKTSDLLGPADDNADVQQPPRFSDAIVEIRAAIGRCEEARVPRDTILAALMAELMPRLVDAYGPGSVASMLNKLACEVSGSGEPPSAIH